MTCPQCQRENPAQARFCMTCGTRLAARCDACGTDLPDEARFCFSCGRPVSTTTAPPTATDPRSYTPKHLADRILASKAALEGERKQVTVLFVDVSGFTSLSERLDPEDVHGLMKRAFELMLDEVHRYDGTVNQFLGDGLMALFGAPIAHEDHARRAVHAALGVRAALERYQEELQARALSFQVRQGLNTGLVVVGSIGNDLRMDYTAVGDTTNVAARMQQNAQRGCIVISDATYRQISGYFHARSVGALTLKGKREPVAAWEVIAARESRSRLDVEAERGLTPFVGRTAELQLLRDRFTRASDGHGQMVFLVGEAGIGKSRLLHELRTVVAAEATWLEGRCLSYGQTIALHPIIGLLKAAFHVEDGDSDETITDKVERNVRRLGADLESALPYFTYLLSVGTDDSRPATMDPRLRRIETFDALRRLLLRAAEVRPQIIAIEDLHWVDKASEDALLSVINSIKNARVLLILTYRPGYQHPFGERTTYTRIALDVLNEAEMVRMTRGVLLAENAPPELDSLVIRRAEGNPFFVEEVVRSLQEVGALDRRADQYVMVRRPSDVDLPGTVQDLIMARIDRLHEPPKRAIQVASVIGREFARKLLDHTAKLDRLDDLLRELQSLELIYEKTPFPDPAFMFKHALTQEVAYNSLLFQRRRELHRLTAMAIEELYSDRLVENYELLAYHYLRAEDWPHALDFLLKAADKAAKTFANREALALLDQALETCGQLGETAPRATVVKIRQSQIGLYFAVADFESTSRAAEALREEAARMGSAPLEAGALSAFAWARLWAHDFARAKERAHEAISLGERTGVGRAVIPARLTLLAERIIKGHLDGVEDDQERIVTIARETGDLAAQGFDPYLKSFIRNWQGEYKDGIRVASEGIAFARQHGLVVPLILNLWTLNLNLVSAGQYSRARKTLEELLTLTERTGEELHWLKALNSLGWLHFECGDLRSAIALNQQCADHVRTKTEPEILGNANLNLADAFLASGDLPLAAELLDVVHRMVDDPAVSEWMKWRYTTHLFASLADLALARGDLAAVQRWTGQCLEVATPRRSRKYISKALRLRAEALLGKRQWTEAADHAQRALETARAIGNPTQLWRGHVVVARLAEARADAPSAQNEWAAAKQVIDSMMTAMADKALAECLQALPVVREIKEGTKRYP